MNQLIQMTAVQTAQAIAAGDVSVSEVTEAHLARIAEVDPALNAVVDKMEDAARDTARAMDANRPEDLPALWGVPVTIKINADLQGYPTSNGVPALNTLPAPGDAAVVANLKAAGGVVIGRTSAPEFSLRWFTSNPIYGVTLNPWDKSLTPGGSSGGASSAVAAGMGCLGHGNDLGGSLRYPAYTCGLATLRPSLGRVPAYYPGATAERPVTIASMSVQGVIARSVADVQAALPGLSRGAWQDPLWQAAPADPKPPKTVGYCVDPFGDGVHPDVERAVIAAVEAAKEAGFELVEVMPPHAAEAAQVWGEILNTETDATTLPFMREHGSAAMMDVFAAYETAFGIVKRDRLVTCQARRNGLRRDWAGMFQKIDALILPVSAMPPFRVEQDFLEPETLPEMIRAQRAMYIINVLGLPSATVRTLDSRPVPLGVQVVGPQMGDEACLSVAARIEGVLGFDLRPIDPVG